MSNASLIRRLTRKKITLPQATKQARAAGDITPEESVDVIIRKVQVGEVTGLVGTPPRLLALAADRREGESKEEQRARVTRALEDDPEIVAHTMKLQSDTTRAVVKLGVVDMKVVLEADPADPDALTPEDFGDDMAYLHDQIVAFSSLPYSDLMKGDSDEAATFPAGELADSPEPDGEALRDTPERPLEIEPG